MKSSKINKDLTATQEESSSMFSKVPAGEYEVSLAHCQFNEKAKSGQAGMMTGYMIESGEHKGKMISSYINLLHEKQDVVEMGDRRLKTIMICQGRTNFKLVHDTDLISRNKFMISVALTPSSYTKDNGDVVETENSDVKKVYAIEGAEKSAPTKAVAKPAAKPATVAVDTDAHVEEEETETPPWMKGY